MSQNSVMLATVDILMSTLDLKEKDCRVTPDGQPYPTAPELFFGVSEGVWKSGRIDFGLEEFFGVTVTISAKHSYVPVDQRGLKTILDQKKGLEYNCRRVIKAVHNSIPLVTRANEILATEIDSGGDAFETGRMLQFQDVSPTVYASSVWWWGSGREDDPWVGMKRTITFFGMHRIQNINDMV